MNKNILIGVAAAVFIVGTGVMIFSDSISLGDVIDSVSGLSPRVMSMVALPFVIVLVVIGIFLLRKSEERKWKQALIKTREANRKREEAKKNASTEG